MQKFALIVAASAALASTASAATLFDNTAGGPATASVFTVSGTAPFFEDATFGIPGAPGYRIDNINIGYDNRIPDNTTSSFDILVQFFDDVDYNVLGAVNTNPIGSAYRIPVFNALPGADETNLVPLPGGPLFLNDGSFGVMVRYVLTGTNTTDPNVGVLMRDTPILLGSSSDFSGIDDIVTDGVITRTNNSSTNERVTFAGGGFPPANLYMAFDGAAVPEPTSLATLALGATALLRRRK